MKQLVIWNGGSGKSAQIQTLRDLQEGCRTSWVEMSRDVDLTAAIGEFAAGGGETVIAAGGDGTVNAVVNAMMQVDPRHRPAMGIIPLGTANDFAGTLQIPDAVEQAVSLIRTHAALPVDVIRIRGEGLDRYYANVAAGGNCVRVSEELTDEMKSRWGAFCYVRGAAGVLADMQCYRVSIEIDEERFDDLKCWTVLVANGKTNAGHIEVAPQASPTDGMFDVVIIREGNVMDMFEIVSGNLLGNFLECEQVIFRHAKRVRLISSPAMRFTLDGELVDREPVEFEIIPSAIEMFAGTGFGNAPGSDVGRDSAAKTLKQQTS